VGGGTAAAASAVVIPMFLLAASQPPRPLVMPARAVSVRLGRGHRTAALGLREPAGAIRLYRLTTPAGDRVRATVQLAHLTARIEIRSVPFSSTSSCERRRGRTVCTVGEEACPTPAGVWRVRIEQRAGPPGRVTLRLVVGAGRAARGLDE
jgi:hypothetical protein